MLLLLFLLFHPSHLLIYPGNQTTNNIRKARRMLNLGGTLLDTTMLVGIATLLLLIHHVIQALQAKKRMNVLFSAFFISSLRIVPLGWRPVQV
jgi:hypothetical protein